ncbi:CgeB family protein [Bacillus sp. es.036]|uniref:CgeB family protein n=1 Tax=Bacillus sp. es.036 TaxID=1761764 RepID=UPI000BF4AE43|nr:DUF3880 domain-containing protein [Bacillus sp. es.036]PFG12752.1 spore maturation protein CgeB [Bacillus sp. es.036]
MKVFYISSGFQGIYEYIDSKIINSIHASKHECCSASLFKGLNHLKEMILEFKPALILTTVGYTFPPQLRDWIDEQRVPIAIWLTEDPYYIDLTVPIIHKYDYIFTIDMAAYERYLKMDHKQVYYLPLGTDCGIHKKRAQNMNYASDICLIGSPYPNRIQLVKYLLNNSNYKMTVVGPEWADILWNYIHRDSLTIIPWVKPELASHYFSNAKINLNIHRPFNLEVNSNSSGVIPKSVNNRTFDIAACQSFQLITPVLDLPIHLKNKKEVVFFEGDKELLETVTFYLKNDDLRKTIAKNAEKKVSEHYTISHSLDYIFTTVEKKKG